MTKPISSNREPVVAGVVLGFASSILSWTGIATVVATRSPEALPGWARSPWVKRVAIPAAAGIQLALSVPAGESGPEIRVCNKISRIRRECSVSRSREAAP